MTPEEISVKEYLEGMINGLAKLTDVRFEAVADKIKAHALLDDQRALFGEHAIKKAEDSMTVRLEGMNQFRDQMKDERGTYATRENLTSVDARLKDLEKANAFASGRIWMFMALFSLIPTIIAIVAFVR